MKLTEKQAKAARQNRLNYEANSAIESVTVTSEGRKLLDQLDRESIGYEEGVTLMIQNLHARGLIPDDAEEETITAE